MRVEPYLINPDDPRAPPQEVWDQLAPEQRAAVVRSLPSEFPVSELAPPKGTPHFIAKARMSDALGGFFSRLGRKVFLACELPVYSSDESMFAPDLRAVMDVETHDRQSWVVPDEGRGLDLALEVYVAGDWRKDVRRNVERYVRLGIRDERDWLLTGEYPPPGTEARRGARASGAGTATWLLD